MKCKVSIPVFLALVLVPTTLLTFALAIRVHAGGIKLHPPFAGTYRTVAYFDHDEPSYGVGANGYVQIYNGEQVPSSYTSKTGEPYPYDGHDGWDWSMSIGTDVLAAAAGEVVVSQDDYGCYGHTIVIDHGNGYYTMYSHLNQRLVGRDTSVTASQHIGESGNSVGPGCGPVGAHLHFSVRHGGYANTTYAVDPFGWRGEGRDPLFDYNGKESTCLWRSRDEDPISCADTIVEDDGGGSTISGAWNESVMGNSYRTHYRNTTNDGGVYATWRATNTNPGPHKVYAYIPSAHATTLNATYHIWNGTNWEQAEAVRQLDYEDEWRFLGTYTLPANNAYVWMYARTNEWPAREIAADAIKFRQYRAYLPLTVNNYCSPHYGQLITNGYFDTGDATGWTTSRSNGPDPIVHPYGDTEYGVWLGRYNSNQDQMYQLVCPAAPADYATFSFRWWMSTSETSTTRDYDFLYVRIRDANGNLLQTVKTITNRSTPKEQWYREYFDLRAYAGQTIRISFEANTDGSLPTNFWIDKVSFFVADW